MKYDGPSAESPLGFPKVRIALWDPRPRFLGMFQAFNLGPDPHSLIPMFGIADHLRTCDCGTPGAPEHPKFHAAAAYVKFGSVIYSVSWPTWFPL